MRRVTDNFLHARPPSLLVCCRCRDEMPRQELVERVRVRGRAPRQGRVAPGAAQRLVRASAVLTLVHGAREPDVSAEFRAGIVSWPLLLISPIA